MKIKSTVRPALVHLSAGWYIMAGTVLEVDGVAPQGGWVQVPPETTLADIEFVQGESDNTQAPSRTRVDYSDVQSESDSDTWYQVSLYSDGTFDCTCAGFLFRKSCKHITRAAPRLIADNPHS